VPDEDLLAARELLLERERQPFGALGPLLDGQAQGQQRVNEPPFVPLQHDPRLRSRRIRQVGDELVQAAGAAEPVVFLLGDGPVAGLVVDLIAAQSIARALVFQAERHERSGHLGDRLERRESQVLRHERQRVAALRAQ
jgi:hypothetical protein